MNYEADYEFLFVNGDIENFAVGRLESSGMSPGGVFVRPTIDDNIVSTVKWATNVILSELGKQMSGNVDDDRNDEGEALVVVKQRSRSSGMSSRTGLLRRMSSGLLEPRPGILEGAFENVFLSKAKRRVGKGLARSRRLSRA